MGSDITVGGLGIRDYCGAGANQLRDLSSMMGCPCWMKGFASTSSVISRRQVAFWNSSDSTRSACFFHCRVAARYSDRTDRVRTYNAGSARPKCMTRGGSRWWAFHRSEFDLEVLCLPLDTAGTAGVSYFTTEYQGERYILPRFCFWVNEVQIRGDSIDRHWETKCIRCLNTDGFKETT